MDTQSIQEEVVQKGRWHHGKLSFTIIIYRTNFQAGTGDHEDEESIREDQHGTFYGIKYISDLNNFVSQRTGFTSLEDALEQANILFPSTKWEKNEI